MPYALPARYADTNNTNGNGQTGQHWQESGRQRAERAARDASPGGTVLDVDTDDGGCARKAHVRDAGGRMRTLTFDGNGAVSGSTDGYN